MKIVGRTYSLGLVPIYVPTIAAARRRGTFVCFELSWAIDPEQRAAAGAIADPEYSALIHAELAQDITEQDGEIRRVAVFEIVEVVLVLLRRHHHVARRPGLIPLRLSTRSAAW